MVKKPEKRLGQKLEQKWTHKGLYDSLDEAEIS